MIKINRQFILKNTGQKLYDLLIYTIRDSLSMLVGGAVMLMFLGEPPFYNPGLAALFVAIGLIFGSTSVLFDILFPDKTG